MSIASMGGVDVEVVVLVQGSTFRLIPSRTSTEEGGDVVEVAAVILQGSFALLTKGLLFSEMILTIYAVLELREASINVRVI